MFKGLLIIIQWCLNLLKKNLFQFLRVISNFKWVSFESRDFADMSFPLHGDLLSQMTHQPAGFIPIYCLWAKLPSWVRAWFHVHFHMGQWGGNVENFWNVDISQALGCIFFNFFPPKLLFQHFLCLVGERVWKTKLFLQPRFVHCHTWQELELRASLASFAPHSSFFSYLPVKIWTPVRPVSWTMEISILYLL